ncbi:hypothetical protein EDD22DRAFT_934349 [Suillus occidentalis]|nr:hypothetical protein EDD22DRAFT_934349 [Suillus occidentalis]
MGPPKASTTFRISANCGPASQFENSVATFVKLKGGSDLEQGEIYLQLSLATLRELADLLEDNRLKPSDKVTFNRAYSAGKIRYDQAVKLRDQLQVQKKSFRKLVVNLFVRGSDAKHFRKVTYRAYKGIKRTSEDLVRHLLPTKDDAPGMSEQNSASSLADRRPARGSPEESVHSQASVSEETLCDVVEGSLSVTDLPPNETIRGIYVDAHNEQEGEDVIATLNRIANARDADIEEEANENEEVEVEAEAEDGAEDEDEDDQATIRPPRSPSCTINVYFNHSVVSFDSELTGTTLNAGTRAAG